MNPVDPLSAEHGYLLDLVDRLQHQLLTAREGVETGRVTYAQHFDYAERVSAMGELLDSALTLVWRGKYGHAFNLLRSALEHHAFDLLYMLGRKHTIAFTGVTEDEWKEWEADCARGEPWTRHIVDWDYRKGNPLITYGGYVSENDPRQKLSLYYFLCRDYDPFQGTVAEQRHLIPNFSGHQHHTRWSRQSQRLHGAYLGWDDLLANLLLNGLLAPKNAIRMGVHYRFLSAFVHPFTDQQDLVFGRHHFGAKHGYDHYSSELGLLYIAVLAARELKAFLKALALPPRILHERSQEMAALVREAESATGYLWFPGQAPHMYDRVQEANNRQMTERRTFTPRSKRTPPDKVRPATVRYYRNPLRRLISMHCTQNELTGWPYMSPWPRSDARFR